MRLKLVEVLFIAASISMGGILISSCGTHSDSNEIPEVKEVFLIGTTPHDDFATTGLLDFTILPKNETGQAIIDRGISVDINVSHPQGIIVAKQESKEVQPQPGNQLAAVLDLDSSGSMRTSDPASLRKEAAKQFVDQIDAADQVAVFDFGAGSSNNFTDSRMLSDFTTDKTAVKTAIDKIKASGGTPMYASISEILTYFEKKFPGDAVSRSMLVLGDGRPNNDRTKDECCNKAKTLGIPINTIGFGPAADQSENATADAVKVLRSLANCSGGAYTGVVDASNLSSVFKNYGQATKLGSVVITVKFSPIPSSENVTGTLSIGNGSQSTPIPVQYSFTAP